MVSDRDRGLVLWAVEWVRMCLVEVVEQGKGRKTRQSTGREGNAWRLSDGMEEAARVASLIDEQRGIQRCNTCFLS